MVKESLAEGLERRAREQGDKLAVRFLVDGEAEEVSWSFGQLADRARAIGAALRARGAAGKPVLLLFPPGLDYVAAFYGCLYARVMAVPAFPPEPSRLHRTLPRLQAIVRDAGAGLALTTELILGMREIFGDLMSSGGEPITWLATDSVGESNEGPEGVGEGEIAFLQYTSGSTSTPRGVMVTHGNLLHNLGAIAARAGTSKEPSFMSWLPPYHDMGLIGGILHPIYEGMPVTLMSPLHFLQRPSRWLAAMSRYGATQSVAPNFAYELCVRKTTPEQRAKLDLHRWESCFNGAEPISARGLERFAEYFGAVGFRRETFIPCYGLAEATLIVSGVRAQEGPTVRRFRRGSIEAGRAELARGERGDGADDGEAVAVVGCGPGIEDQAIRIVDPVTRERRRDGEVGEIWLSSPSIAKGYWNRPEETAATFGATLIERGEGGSADGSASRPAAEDDETRFLRTGDLGFTLDGELYVTGRIKDLIIIAGQNHYPQDLERTAESAHPNIRPGASAAFSVTIEDEEKVVLVLELDGEPEPALRQEIASNVRAAIARDHQLALQAIVLTPRNAVPRTSSGKVQRYLCRTAWREGTLERHEPGPRPSFDDVARREQ